PHVAELKQQLLRKQQRMEQALRYALQDRRERLARARRSPFFVHPKKYMLDQAQRLDRLRERLESRMKRISDRGYTRLARQQTALAAHHPGERVAFAAKQLQSTSKGLEQAMAAYVKDNKMQLFNMMKQLDALSPLKVMSRGYSLVYDENERKLIKSISEVKTGALIKVKLADGQLDCEVRSTEGERSGESSEKRGN
ncbi:exodeoxyribonuclease VII large subunit, partial [Paenibacillus sp. MCAF20]